MCKHIPHTPSIRALTASSCHGKFRAQCLGVPGATATRSWEQDPCFCWSWMGRSLEPHLLNFLTSAQKPTLEVPRHFTHTPSLGATFTRIGATGWHPPRFQVQTLWPSSFLPGIQLGTPSHVQDAQVWDCWQENSGNTQKSMVHRFMCRCACIYVFVCINVYMYYVCVSWFVYEL